MVFHHFFLLSSLIIGTTIGAGMLSLPLLCQNVSQLTILIFFFSAAFIMYQCAHYLIEVSYKHQRDTNLISYLKKYQKELIIPTQIAYLLFLYSLLAAYLTALSESSQNLMTNPTVAKMTFGSLFALFLLLAPLLRAKINEFFVAIMFMTLAYLFYSLENPQVPSYILSKPTDLTVTKGIFGIILMSFGFHHIIPSLTTISPDQKTLKHAVKFSLLIITLIYLYWVNLILSLNASQDITMNNAFDFLTYLDKNALTKKPKLIIQVFSFLAALTSCIGVCIGLKDFIADTLRPLIKKRTSLSDLFLVVLTITPSIILCVAITNGFETILYYSSFFSFFIIIFLPCWLHKKVYHTTTPILTMIIALIIMVLF